MIMDFGVGDNAEHGSELIYRLGKFFGKKNFFKFFLRDGIVYISADEEECGLEDVYGDGGVAYGVTDFFMSMKGAIVEEVLRRAIRLKFALR